MQIFLDKKSSNGKIIAMWAEHDSRKMAFWGPPEIYNPDLQRYSGFGLSRSQCCLRLACCGSHFLEREGRARC